TPFFSLNSVNGELTLGGPLDFEVARSYMLVVIAEDLGVPKLESRTTVIIEVTDISDMPPRFLQSSYLKEIEENTPIPVFRRVLYHLVGADSVKFAIDPTSGTLYINKTLDYEKQINFTFDVVATETDTSEKFSANASVTLTLININDNKPMFAKSSYNYTMDEEITPGTHIADITATDADLGTFGALTYELRGGQAAYFSVNADNGTISAAQILDYDTLPQYQFSLMAKDGGGFYQEIAIATVTVTLQDVNDNDPEFTGMPYTSDIAENLPAGTIVFQVTATDKDSGENGRVSAYDHGVPSRHRDVQLTVNVLDENDNTPQITDGLTITTNISEVTHDTSR
ncbi:predicted protein, partial [Nematostella vectensis]